MGLSIRMFVRLLRLKWKPALIEINLKSQFTAKLIFILSIFVLLSTDKKAKPILLRVFFKKMDFKNLQQETTKGNLRP